MTSDGDKPAAQQIACAAMIGAIVVTAAATAWVWRGELVDAYYSWRYDHYLQNATQIP